MMRFNTGSAFFISPTFASLKLRGSILSLLLSVLLLLPGLSSFAQSEIVYDEKTLFLEAPHLGAKEIIALVRSDVLFLPVKQVFEFHNIWINPSTAFETLSGFIYDRESAFMISWSKNEILYKGKTDKLNPDDLIQKDQDIYLNAKYFERIFGLECDYNFKKQSVIVEPVLDIPNIRYLSQEDLYVNLRRLTGKDYSDVELRRFYPLFNIGTADWSIISRQELNGSAMIDANLGLGAVVAGGELIAKLNYNSSEHFREKDQHYLWRFVDNDNTAFSQVHIGKIDILSTSTIKDPILGIKLTNTPTSLRKSQGTYRYIGKTDPNWIVELYVNNILVAYAKADGSGSYIFDIPLAYGNTPMRLKFYGPWGEERSREKTISLPFNFVPGKTLEYDISGGIIQDSVRSRILRMSANYGITNNITIGAGYEFIPSVPVNPMMPFVRTSIRPFPSLILSGEIAYKVRAKSTLIYRLPSNIQLDLHYTKYSANQPVLHHDYLEERNVSILLPVNLGKFPVNNRLTFHQIISGENSLSSGSLISYSLFGDYFEEIPPVWYISGPREDQDSLLTKSYTFAEWLISGNFNGIHTNITTTGLFTDGQTPNIYSTLSLSYRFRSGLRVTPMAQYSYTGQQFQSLGILLEHKLFKHAYLNMSFEQDLQNNLQHAELGFRYNFAFAQTGISGIHSDNSTSFVQYARGSIISDRRSNFFKADEISNLGKGGITLIPFFDENYNGMRDSGEEKVSGLDLRVSSGEIERIEKDTTIRITGLEPYTRCLIELDDRGFDDSPLKLLNSSYNVHIDANFMKDIEVPLIVAGKASGTVRINWSAGIQGLEDVVLQLYDRYQKQVGRIFSKSDGSYSFEGLPIGDYVVKIDSILLERIGMPCAPDSIHFQIKDDSAGLEVTGLDFMFGSTQEPPEITTIEVKPDSVQKIHQEPGKEDSVQNIISEPEVQITRKDSISIKIHELVQEVTDTTDSYSIQLGAFGRESNAIAFRKKMAALLDRDIEIVFENGLYKIRIQDFESREEVDAYLPELSENGIEELWVINMRAMRQEMTLMTLKDTLRQVIEIRTEMPDPTDHSGLDLQLGAFRDPTRAEALLWRLSTSQDQPVIILEEDGYSKVRLTGFTLPEQRDAMLPELFELGFTDVWVLPYDTALYAPEEIEYEEFLTEVYEEEKIEQTIEEAVPTEEIPEEIVDEEIVEEILPEVEVAEEVVEEAAEEIVAEEIPEVAAPEEKVADDIDVESLIEEPRFSIQAGVFAELSEARRAQRRILNKLGLESILVEEYDFTRLLIPGFYSRRETYKYYPELAGLGYDQTMVIEKR